MSVKAIIKDVPEFVSIKTALLSVSDKTGLVELANELASRNVRLLSTGGTAAALREAGFEITDVSQVTGFPEIMDGRVKTLHPAIHGGLLGIRTDQDHVSQMKAQSIEPIDLVVVNLYPFEATVNADASSEEIIENIDIGGPAMIRAAAKNHAFVSVVTDPADYPVIIDQLKLRDGSVDLEFRRNLAAKAFKRTASYDAAVSAWFDRSESSDLPERLEISGVRQLTLRYGENPHQRAGFYKTVETHPSVSTARLVQGKQLSYNNINDTDAAFELVSEFGPGVAAAVAIIKHANPCGVAVGTDLTDAYRKALACDPVSAFGGIVALNQKLDQRTAREIVKTFTEVIVAPEADEAAMELISGKPNLRLLLTGGVADPRREQMAIRSVSGGFLVQSGDNQVVDDLDIQTVTRRAPTEEEMNDLKFAFRVAKHVKSNAIVYAKNGATVGIGAGQMSRVDSSRIAARKAADSQEQQRLEKSPAVGSVVASDAFFPFADGLLSAVEAGATAVIQPGGSMRDEEVIAAADDAGIAMVFTGMRHFRH